MVSVSIDNTMKKISFALGVDIRLFHLYNNTFELVSLSLGREEIIKLDKDIIYDPNSCKLYTNRDDLDIYQILFDNSLLLINKGHTC